MAVPVSIKGKEGATVMPMEAIAMAIMNNAMRGDLAAANFIRQLTGTLAGILLGACIFWSIQIPLRQSAC